MTQRQGRPAIFTPEFVAKAEQFVADLKSAQRDLKEFERSIRGLKRKDSTASDVSDHLQDRSQNTHEGKRDKADKSPAIPSGTPRRSGHK